MVVQASGVYASRLHYLAGGTDSVKQLTHLDHAMVIAMSAVRKMQMAVNQIVDMVAVRNRLMPACRPMAMGGLMGLAIVVGGTISGIHSPYSQGVFIHVFIVREMQMSIMKVILMVLVPDNGMATIGTVCVGMFVMNAMVAHDASF
nr:hypothetical protein [Candidatus Nitrospira neomarina]